MTAILLFITLAITVEGIVEYIKSIIQQKDTKTIAIQMGALAASMILCVLSGADVYAFLGIDFNAPFVGAILTGIFASRGANYASDFIGKLQSVNNK